VKSTAFASVVLLCTVTMASAQSAPPDCGDADFTRLCVSHGDSPQTCACRINVMHEVLTPDEIKWACWFQSNQQAAERALEMFKETEKAEALGGRLIERGHIINQRCAEVR
jgi:hypothetical protein